MAYCYQNNLFNGSVLVAEKGKLLYKNTFGFSNFESYEKMKSTTPSCIGSVTKQFTAMAIMILKEQNKLSYGDKLAGYFPEIPGANKITIRHLLNHTSGTIRYVSLPEMITNGRIRTGLKNQDVYEILLKKDSLIFEPGEKYAYTNCGYILLAMIVESVSGKSFSKFMKQYVFDPLEMKHSFVNNESNFEKQNKAIGYDQFGEIHDYNVFVEGAGGIYSTVEDLYKWDRSLYTEQLVSKKTLKEAFTPGVLNNGKSSRILSDSTWGYGFGWLLRKTDSENIIWHDGGFNGFSAVFYRELNQNQCIVILSNKGSSGLSAPVYPVQKRILNILNEESYDLPKIPVSLKLKELIDNTDLDSAICQYHKMKKIPSSNYDFSEGQLNRLGYYYLGKSKNEFAIELFKLNIKMFPEYANGYDSLGEGYMKNGQTELAIKNYNKSLELDPGNDNARRMLKKLMQL